ncbi:regulator of chromosome condensation 1/beta-lactamase-inhibitor protein II [Baffinella frigidus]|nr:regulator of chromosome condensation 1/beta-lactamase-inhibitor protein II [Cryptophyta sp. CCMP2293]
MQDTAPIDPALPHNSDIEGKMRGMLGEELRDVMRDAGVQAGGLQVDLRNVLEPQELEALKGFRLVDAACGLFHTLFLVERVYMRPDLAPSDRGERRVFAAGNNDVGQLGVGECSTSLKFRTALEIETVRGMEVVGVYAGWDYSLCLLASGEVVGFGWDQHGQLGAGTKDTIYSKPVKMRGLGPEAGPDAQARSGGGGAEGEGGAAQYGPARLVAAGDTHVLVAPARGGLLAVGLNDHGQLGLGDHESRSVAAPRHHVFCAGILPVRPGPPRGRGRAF